MKRLTTTLSGSNLPTTYELPLSLFERLDLREEERWRHKQYMHALLEAQGTSSSLLTKLRAHLEEVTNMLDENVRKTLAAIDQGHCRHDDCDAEDVENSGLCQKHIDEFVMETR